MTPEVLKSMLLATTTEAKWLAQEVPNFAAPNFRSRPPSPETTGIQGLFGLRLGDYPVIVAPIQLVSAEAVMATLRQLHAQMVVARSYMGAAEVINAHLFLCATSPTPTGDWKQVVDLVERDESVCRKVIWIPNQSDLQGSYRAFVARTFLAMPWVGTTAIRDARLDETHQLAERILVRHGLQASIAHQWVELALQFRDDPDSLVTQLVAANEVST